MEMLSGQTSTYAVNCVIIYLDIWKREAFDILCNDSPYQIGFILFCPDSIHEREK